jgi:nicotinate-nucleotide adenylyltransferase
MVRLATRSNPHFSVSDVELSRSGKSYSIDTIRFFRDRGLDALFFILGNDAFVEIETWKESQNLFSICDLIVMMKPGAQKTSLPSPIPKTLIQSLRYDLKEDTWIHLSGHRLYFKEISFLDISSTKVRELIEKGRSARYLIPDEVEAYVRNRGLYRKKP